MREERYVQRERTFDLASFQQAVIRMPAVLRQFGFSSMRPGQEQVVHNILGKRDLLAVLPTSMGKTFCFQAATLAMGWKTLVFSPLIALIRDQVQKAVEKGLRVAALTSHNSDSMNRLHIEKWVRGELDFLYVAPERLWKEEFIAACRMVPPNMIAVDEAHTLSAWSDTFRSAYKSIGDFITQHRPEVVTAFTATCPPQVERDIREVLCLQHAPKILNYPRRSNLDLRSLPWRGLETMVPLIERAGSSVIYCVTRDRTEQTAMDLQKMLGDKKRIAFYHGGMRPSDRSHIQDSYANGDLDVIVATNAFGMGVDKSDVRLVIHRDIACSMEGQSQEDGRAGRDGNYSMCMTFYDSESVNKHNFMIRTSNPVFKEVRAVFEVMRKSVDATGQVGMPADQIAKACGLHPKYMSPIYQILSGSRVITSSKAAEKKWGFHIANQVEEPDFLEVAAAIEEYGERDPDGLIYVKMKDLEEATGFSQAVLKNRFGRWKERKLIEFEAPGRANPVKLIGNISNVDADRIDTLRKMSMEKLEQVLTYTNQVSDKDKHDYVEVCMNTKTPQSAV
jgi:RecQ family ATP-dependent DNA helicase